MIKQILAQVKEFKKASILAPMFMVGEVILEVSLPFLMSFIIDKGVNVGDMSQVLLYGSIMVVCAMLSLVCGTLSAKYASYASAGLARNLRQAVYYKIQELSFRNIDKFSTSGLVTRSLTDVTNVQNAYQMVLRMCVRAPLTLICALCMTIYISGKLSLVFVAAGVFLIIVLGIIIANASPTFIKVFGEYDNLNASVQENVTNIRVVKAYVKEDKESAKFEKAAKALRKMFTKAENILIFNSPAMQLAMYGSLLAISWLGANMIVSGTLLTGQLMSMFTYTTNILMSLMMISMIFVMLSMSSASAKRIGEILVEVADISNPNDPVMEVKDGSVEFNDVCFSYANDTNYSLENINIKIKSGETIGVMGATGCGKTSLVQLVARLYDASKGEVKVGGVDVKQYDLKTLRDSVAMVLQKNVLFSGTIKDNLRWGDSNASDEDMVRVCKIAQADDFIEQFVDKYDTRIEQGGTNVSGGQKQRLCIARALLKNPKIIILDDSTNAVDTKTDAKLQKAFKEDLGKVTKLIISQRISSLQQADRIIVMEDGKINDIGSHSELLARNAIYQDVANTQSEGGVDDES